MAYREQHFKATPGPDSTMGMGTCHRVPCFSISPSPGHAQSLPPQTHAQPHALAPRPMPCPTCTQPPPHHSQGPAAGVGMDVVWSARNKRLLLQLKPRGWAEISIASLFSSVIK